MKAGAAVAEERPVWALAGADLVAIPTVKPVSPVRKSLRPGLWFSIRFTLS
jgi:hypothetical protein